MSFALKKLRAAGVPRATVDTFFQDALIAPVLTAHPTEVQRKSILDAEHDIARLLAERDTPQTPKERLANMQLLRSRVATLWQTRMLRYSKLTVADEIENALSYYRITFLRELPALYDDIEDDIAAEYPNPDGTVTPIDAAYVQMGSWIGGDRDGNPNVNAGTMQHALARHATTILDFYLDEVHALGAELSVSTLLVGVSARTAGAGRAVAGRFAAPQRRALPARPDRHLCAPGRHRARAGRDQYPAQGSGRRPRPTLTPPRLRPT